MKIDGKVIEPPKPVYIPIPREGAEDIILTAQPVIDMSEFDQVYPEPKPPFVDDRKNKKKYHDYDDPKYQSKIEKRIEARQDYIVIKSLSATPGLEWEIVDIKDPDTWKFYREELQQSFTAPESEYIIMQAILANMPTEDRRKEALNLFTSRQEQEKVFSSLTDEQNSTPSGEPANV